MRQRRHRLVTGKCHREIRFISSRPCPPPSGKISSVCRPFKMMEKVMLGQNIEKLNNVASSDTFENWLLGVPRPFGFWDGLIVPHFFLSVAQIEILEPNGEEFVIGVAGESSTIESWLIDRGLSIGDFLLGPEYVEDCQVGVPVDGDNDLLLFEIDARVKVYFRNHEYGLSLHRDLGAAFPCSKIMFEAHISPSVHDGYGLVEHWLLRQLSYRFGRFDKESGKFRPRVAKLC